MGLFTLLWSFKESPTVLYIIDMLLQISPSLAKVLLHRHAWSAEDFEKRYVYRGGTMCCFAS